MGTGTEGDAVTDVPRLVLTWADLYRLRVGDIRRGDTSDGARVLVVSADSPSRQHIIAADRVVLTAGELDLIEVDPAAGQIVTVEGQPGRLLHIVGAQR